MPIYKFYCKPCNTIYKFFSNKVSTKRIPQCPVCENPEMMRKMFIFASLSHKKENINELTSLNESKVEKVMSMLTREVHIVDENNPRETARRIRKLSDVSGLNLGAGMQEALNRVENGEDLEKMEEDLGELLDEDDPFIVEKSSWESVRKNKPMLNDKLYDM